MRKRRGFTLLELLIVVVIIGILATFAIPQFLKATERAKVGKAKNALGLISQGEKMYFADQGDYLDVTLGGDFSPLDEYIEIADQLNADGDWDYEVVLGDIQTGAGEDIPGFTITAEREGTGGYSGDNVTLNSLGGWCGDHPMAGGDEDCE